MNPVWLFSPFFYYPLWEAAHVRVKELEIAYPNLPSAWSGLKILYVSDSHILRRGRRERLFERLMANQETDLLILGGDIAATAKGYRIGLSALSRTTVRVGKFATWGNSENLAATQRNGILEALRNHGYELLANERRLLRREDAPLAICGSNCPYSGLADMGETLDGLDASVFRILMMHAPEGLLEIGDRRADLILSGHTHGGQIRIPGLRAIHLHTHTPVNLDRGLFDAESLRRFWPEAPETARMAISAGVGTSTLPTRLFCPPDILKITLLRADAEDGKGSF